MYDTPKVDINTGRDILGLTQGTTKMLALTSITVADSQISSHFSSVFTSLVDTDTMINGLRSTLSRNGLMKVEAAHIIISAHFFVDFIASFSSVNSIHLSVIYFSRFEHSYANGIQCQICMCIGHHRQKKQQQQKMQTPVD